MDIQVWNVIERILVLRSYVLLMYRYVCTHMVREEDTYVHVSVLLTSQANNQNSHVEVL